MAKNKVLIYEDYMIDGKLYEISKAVLPHKYVDRLALTKYEITNSSDPNRYCLKSEIKVEKIKDKEFHCSKIYVDKDNKVTSFSSYPYKDDFIDLFEYFGTLIDEGYFKENGINIYNEVKENIKRLGIR